MLFVPSATSKSNTSRRAVNRSGAADDLKTDDDKKKEKEVKPLVEKIKSALGDRVKNVVASSRLSDSPSCIVADENDPTMQMQHILKSMGQSDIPDIKPILEINPDHPIVQKLSEATDEKVIEDVSWLLFEQALLVEGVELKKPAEFVKRLNRVMAQAL